MNLPATADSPPATAIDHDLPCTACGYNLRTLARDAPCPECGQPVAQTLADTAQRRRVFTLDRFPVFSRVLCLLLGVLLPVIPFTIMEFDAADGGGTLFVEWQSGQTHDHLALMIGGVLLVGVLPGIAIPRRLTMPPLPPVARKIAWYLIGGLALLIIVASGIATLLTGNPRDVLEGLVSGPLILYLMTAPALYLAVHAMTLIRLWRSGVLGAPLRPMLAGIGAWLAAYTGAWALGVLAAIRQYQSLPTQPPSCYIATAAARGHRRLVGSVTAPLAGGSSFALNRQLQVLKIGEIALASAAPALHRRLRRGYDQLGPRLAARLTHPLAADLAWLTLTPLAGLTRLVLRPLVPRLDHHIAAMYREPQTTAAAFDTAHAHR